MGCTWLMSDPHFGHKNICKYRKDFSTREEHDETLFNNIIQTVKKRDTLWLLGDTCFDEESYDKIVEISKAVGNLNYIPGNHDTDNATRNNLYKKMVSEGLFNKTGSMFKLGDYWLTHPPIHPTELRGRSNIHGHTHSVHMRMPEDYRLPYQDKDPRYINICAENIGYTPINYDKIRIK